VYNPEFLTEANAKYEFVNPEFHIVGGTPEACEWITLGLFNILYV
jgi:UDP-glucose 6-dehydrogenase